MKTIDVTPTWRAILPMLLAAYENGTDEGRKIAVEELQRMATIADLVADNPRPLGPVENIGSYRSTREVEGD